MTEARIAIAALLALGAAGCNQLADEMRRAEATYEDARYENTLIWLTDLEDDAPGMDQEMRARYFFLRGMTEYRLGHRQDALHYLAVAREVAGDQGAGLRPQWREMMDRTLAELMPRGRQNHRASEPEDEAPPAVQADDPPSDG